MNDDLRVLAALDALGVLPAADARRLAVAVDADAELAAQRDADQAVVAALESVVARVAPPDLAERIVAAARADSRVPKAAEDPRRRGATGPRRRLVPTLAAALAAAAAAVAITLLATRDPGLGTPTTQAIVVPHSPGAQVGGKAALYDPTRPGGILVVDLNALPPAPAGHHYAVWVLRSGAGQMEPVGTFSSTRPSVHLELPLPGSGSYGALDVSIQADGGPPAHSGRSVAGATFGT